MRPTKSITSFELRKQENSGPAEQCSLEHIGHVTSSSLAHCGGTTRLATDSLTQLRPNSAIWQDVPSFL